MQIKSPVVFFVGENGCGKTTILEALAQAAQIRLIGHKSNDPHPFGPGITALSHQMRLTWSQKTRKGFYMSAESFFAYILNLKRIKKEDMDELNQVQKDYKDRSVFAREQASLPYKRSLMEMQQDYGEGLDALSHGEGFITFFQKRLVGKALYLLDEPEAPLSPIRQLTLISLIHEMVQAGGQFVIATHSPILMAYPGAEIYRLEDGKINQTVWEELESVQIMQDYMQNPSMFLRQLLRD